MTHFAVAEVVHQDEHDVRLLLRCRAWPLRGQRAGRDDEHGDERRFDRHSIPIITLRFASRIFWTSLAARVEGRTVIWTFLITPA
jgi:hypothetical protein